MHLFLVVFTQFSLRWCAWIRHRVVFLFSISSLAKQRQLGYLCLPPQMTQPWRRRGTAPPPPMPPNNHPRAAPVAFHRIVAATPRRRPRPSSSSPAEISSAQGRPIGWGRGALTQGLYELGSTRRFVAYLLHLCYNFILCRPYSLE
jgi:hypothetical protein